MIWFSHEPHTSNPKFSAPGDAQTENETRQDEPTIGPIHSLGVQKNDKSHPPTFAVHQGYGAFKTGDPVRFTLNVAPHGN
jgi:hypothetical protein